MFEKEIVDIFNNALALEEEHEDKRIEAMLYVWDLFKSFDDSNVNFSKRVVYYLIIKFLLDNDYYSYLTAVDFDIIYRLLGD